MRRRLSSRVSVAAVLTLVAGVTVTGVLFYAVSALEYGKQSLGFQQGANVRVAALRRGLDDAVEVLTVTNQLFRTLPPESVTREQFGSFTRPLLQRYPFIQSFAYHRLLRHDERAGWERDVQRTWPGVTVRDLGPASPCATWARAASCRPPCGPITTCWTTSSRSSRIAPSWASTSARCRRRA